MTEITPSKKGEKRRAEILSAARTQLIEGGYEGFSMREVAASLGTKLGHIQYYFASKGELLETLIRDEFDSNIAVASTIIEQASEAEPALDQTVRTLVDLWYSEGKYVYALMSFLALHDARFCALNDEINRKFYALIGDMLSAHNPGLTAAEIGKRAKLITALMDGGLLHLHVDTEGSEAFVQDIVEAVNMITNAG